MKLAFAILAHDDPDNLLRLVRRLVSGDDLVVIHWDRKNRLDITNSASRKLPPEERSRVRFARRHRVEWGSWPMVEATLACLEEISTSGETVDYVILLSGADYPIRPLEHLKAFLASDGGREYIESVDPKKKRWVVDGFNVERVLYRFYFNWKRHPRLFSWSIAAQKFFALRRMMPDGLEPRLGAQWWALTWQTAREILERSKAPHIRRFFRRTWVPDENFFQTMVADIVSDDKIAQRSLTFYHFSTAGKPLVFYNDHAEFLTTQPFFFARKLSPHAHVLRDVLDAAGVARGSEPPPRLDLVKNVKAYHRLVYLQRHAPPNRRVIGGDHDGSHGDLNWNRVPYFVLIDFGRLDLSGLRNALNGTGRICCFGELFDPARIDYDLSGEEHPGYPSDAPALRDHSPTTFLFDLLHLKPRQGIAGFVASIDRADAAFVSSLRDPRALPVFLVPNHLFQTTPNQNSDIHVSYKQRVLQDLLDTSGYPGWRTPLICLYEDQLSPDDVRRIEAGVLAWREGRPL